MRHWTGILARITRDYQAPGVTTNEPISARLLTTLFTPEQVSTDPDERLLVLATFEGTGICLDHPAGVLNVGVTFTQLLELYATWDVEGVSCLTEAGKARARSYLAYLME